MECGITEQLLKEASRIYTETGTLTNEILSALQFMYQAPLLPALDLLDHDKVTKMAAPSSRSAYQVLGSSGVPYICPSGVDYCGCAAFRYSVLKKGDYIACKHLIAIMLGEAMKRVKLEDVTDEELTLLLQQIE